MRFGTKLLPGVAALMLLILLSGCFGDDEEEREPAAFADVRAYAGLQAGVAPYFDLGERVYIEQLDEGGPALQAGLERDDLVRSIDGESVSSEREIYGLLEDRAPGDTVEVEVDRFIPPIPEDGSAPDTEELTLMLQLAEEPPPDEFSLWVPYTDLDYQDHVRIGVAFISEITRPLADYYGLAGPEGVLVRAPSPLRMEAGLEEGDVITSITGEEVNYLREVQEIIDGMSEDETITLIIQRSGQEQSLDVGVLGPNLPGANALPVEPRQRLAEAVEDGGLHPDNVPLVTSSFSPRPPASGEPGRRGGVITDLTGDSITIELYATGDAWSLELVPDTSIGGGGVNSAAELETGDFVEVMTQDGETAILVASRVEAPR